MLYNELCDFIVARHRVYQARNANQRKPWTEDPILQKYRFCNVYRELDAVTQWIGERWRWPHRENEDLWFAMVIARLFNEPATLEEIGFPTPFNRKHILNVAASRRIRGERVFNPAYIVSTNGVAMDKVQYVCDQVLIPLWECRKRLRPQQMESLASYAERLIKFKGLGGFMVGQVIADLKYVEPLKSAVDWQSWAISGPGSRRGLNRVLERPLYAPWKESEWLKTLDALRLQVNTRLIMYCMDTLHAQDLQNCLCEFDKYMRVKTGEGTPKQRYKGV